MDRDMLVQDLCCQRVLGKFVVSMFVCMFVGITWVASHAHKSSVSTGEAAMFCRAVIYFEALVAFSCLATLQYCGSCTVAVRRTPERCFPLPDELVHGLRRAHAEGPPSLSVTTALRHAASGMHNVSDPAGQRGVYCVRCFVWRAEDGHHCAPRASDAATRTRTHNIRASPHQLGPPRAGVAHAYIVPLHTISGPFVRVCPGSECQRCVEDFDHHCGVLGCCVAGRGLKGNMWLFLTLISMAAVT
jgi:hypothetical protein